VAARRRLILTNVAVVAIVLTLLGVVVYLFNAQAAQQEVDAQLRRIAEVGSRTVGGHQFQPPPPGGPPDRLVPYAPTTPDIFSVVLDPQGNILADFDQVQALGVPVATAAGPVLRGEQPRLATTVQAGGHDFRLYIAAASQQGHLVGAVVAGMSLDLQDQQRGDLLRALAIVYGVVLLLTVLSSLLLTDRALRPAQRAFARQRQFATAASHELKTPLAVIRSEAELASGLLSDSLAALRTPPPDLKELTDALQEAFSETRAVTVEVDFMTRMVRDLLLLARDASDALAHDWVILDLRALVAEVAARIQPVAEADGVTLRATAPATGERTPIWVRGDAALLRQLLYGLLENALRYTPTGGDILAEVRAESRTHLLGDRWRHATLSIRDTGIGIAAEHLPNIFEPFYRAVSTTRPLHGEAQGTGLGLAMAQWIVRAHGGTIAVHSTSGQGTTFTVALPLATEEEAASVEHQRRVLTPEATASEGE
jgi:signal transduction histidine kinase